MKTKIFFLHCKECVSAYKVLISYNIFIVFYFNVVWIHFYTMPSLLLPLFSRGSILKEIFFKEYPIFEG